MRARMNFCWIFGLVFLLLIKAVSAQGIGIDELEVSADIGEETNVTAVYLVSNGGDSGVNITLSFPEMPELTKIAIDGQSAQVNNPIMIPAKEKKRIELAFTKDAQNFYYYDLSMLINGYRPDYMRHTKVTYFLPREYTLLETSGTVTRDDSQTIISWERNNSIPLILPQDFQVRFSSRSFDIDVLKAIDKSIIGVNDAANVTLTLKNYGNRTDNLRLEDFLPGDAVYAIYSDTGNILENDMGSKVIWDISSLGEGETREFSYTVKVNSESVGNVSLTPAKLIDQEASIEKPSNPLMIQILGETSDKRYCVINGICEKDENTSTCPKDCKYDSASPVDGIKLVGFFAVLILLAAVGYLIYHKMKKQNQERNEPSNS